VAHLKSRIEALSKEAVPALGGDAVDPQPPGWKAPAIYGEP
jgi:hypothetical protein